MNDFFYKNLDAYKAAKDLTLYVYSLLKKYPSHEQYALCNQMRRATISIPSNLAEGMYIAYFHISEINDCNELHDLDQSCKIYFEVVNDSLNKTNWKRQYWGSIRLPQLREI